MRRCYARRCYTTCHGKRIEARFFAVSRSSSRLAARADAWKPTIVRLHERPLLFGAPRLDRVVCDIPHHTLNIVAAIEIHLPAWPAPGRVISASTACVDQARSTLVLEVEDHLLGE